MALDLSVYFFFIFYFYFLKIIFTFKSLMFRKMYQQKNVTVFLLFQKILKMLICCFQLKLSFENIS